MAGEGGEDRKRERERESYTMTTEEGRIVNL